LAVSLRVEYGRELNLNPEDTAEFIPEVRYKLGTTVRDNRFGSAVESIDIIDVKASHILCSCGLKVREGDRLLV
jgi:hypothetical protein